MALTTALPSPTSFPATTPFPATQPAPYFGITTPERLLQASVPGLGGIPTPTATPTDFFNPSMGTALNSLTGGAVTSDPRKWTPAEAAAQTDRAIARIGAVNPQLAQQLQAQRTGQPAPASGGGFFHSLMSGLSEVLHVTHLDQVFSVLGRASHIVPEILADEEHQSVWGNVAQALAGHSNKGWGQVEDKYGIFQGTDLMSRIAHAAVAFTGDVATDPLTYIMPGAGAISREILGETGAKAIFKAAVEGDARLSGLLGRLGEEGTGQLWKAVVMGNPLDEGSNILGDLMARLKAEGVNSDALAGIGHTLASQEEANGLLDAVRKADTAMQHITAGRAAGSLGKDSAKLLADKLGMPLEEAQAELRRVLSAGNGFVSKSAYEQAKAASVLLGDGIKLRGSIPVFGLRFITNAIPGTSKLSFAFARQFTAGLSGYERLTKMVANGEADLTHLEAFFQGGFKGLQKFSAQAGDSVARDLANGTFLHGGSFLYPLSDQVGGFTAMFSPHAKLLRGGGIGELIASNSARTAKSKVAAIADQILTIPDPKNPNRMLTPQQVESLYVTQFGIGALRKDPERLRTMWGHVQEYLRLMPTDEAHVMGAQKFWDARIQGVVEGMASGQLGQEEGGAVLARFRELQAKAVEHEDALRGFGPTVLDGVRIHRQVVQQAFDTELRHGIYNAAHAQGIESAASIHPEDVADHLATGHESTQNLETVMHDPHLLNMESGVVGKEQLSATGEDVTAWGVHLDEAAPALTPEEQYRQAMDASIGVEQGAEAQAAKADILAKAQHAETIAAVTAGGTPADVALAGSIQDGFSSVEKLAVYNRDGSHGGSVFMHSARDALVAAGESDQAATDLIKRAMARDTTAAAELERKLGAEKTQQLLGEAANKERQFWSKRTTLGPVGQASAETLAAVTPEVKAGAEHTAQVEALAKKLEAATSQPIAATEAAYKNNIDRLGGSVAEGEKKLAAAQKVLDNLKHATNPNPQAIRDAEGEVTKWDRVLSETKSMEARLLAQPSRVESHVGDAVHAAEAADPVAADHMRVYGIGDPNATAWYIDHLSLSRYLEDYPSLGTPIYYRDVPFSEVEKQIQSGAMDTVLLQNVHPDYVDRFTTPMSAATEARQLTTSIPPSADDAVRRAQADVIEAQAKYDEHLAWQARHGGAPDSQGARLSDRLIGAKARLERAKQVSLDGDPAKPVYDVGALPPVPAGSKRLYRGGEPGSDSGGYGNWATTDIEEAKSYAETRGSLGNPTYPGQLYYVDIPEADFARQLRERRVQAYLEGNDMTNAEFEAAYAADPKKVEREIMQTPPAEIPDEHHQLSYDSAQRLLPVPTTKLGATTTADIASKEAPGLPSKLVQSKVEQLLKGGQAPGAVRQEASVAARQQRHVSRLLNPIVRDLSPGGMHSTSEIDLYSQVEQQVRKAMAVFHDAAGQPAEKLDGEVMRSVTPEVAAILKQDINEEEKVAQAVTAVLQSQGHDGIVTIMPDGTKHVTAFYSKNGPQVVKSIAQDAPRAADQMFGTLVHQLTPSVLESVRGVFSSERQGASDVFLRRLASELVGKPLAEAEAKAREVLRTNGITLGEGAQVFETDPLKVASGLANSVASRATEQYLGRAARRIDIFGLARSPYRGDAVGIEKFKFAINDGDFNALNKLGERIQKSATRAAQLTARMPELKLAAEQAQLDAERLRSRVSQDIRSLKGYIRELGGYNPETDLKAIKAGPRGSGEWSYMAGVSMNPGMEDSNVATAVLKRALRNTSGLEGDATAVDLGDGVFRITYKPIREGAGESYDYFQTLPDGTVIGARHVTAKGTVTAVTANNFGHNGIGMRLLKAHWTDAGVYSAKDPIAAARKLISRNNFTLDGALLNDAAVNDLMKTLEESHPAQVAAAEAEAQVNKVMAKYDDAVRELNKMRTELQTKAAKVKPALLPAADSAHMAGFERLGIPGLSDLSMPSFMAQEFYKAARGFKSLTGFHAQYRQFMSWWKTWATYMFPGFHARNFMGAFFNNWLGGVTIQDYVFASRIRKGAHEILTGGNKWKDAKIATRDLQHLREMGLNQILSPEALQSLTYSDLGTLLSDLGINSAHGRAFAEARVGTEHLEESLGKKTLFEKIPVIGEPYVRAAKGAGTLTENLFRTAAFVRGMKNTGGDIWGARAFTMLRHGDYQDLTDWEYGWVRDLIPFYKWMRTNTPFQLHQLFESPGKLLAVPKLQNAVWSAAGLDFNKDKYKEPTWMRDSIQLPTPGSKDDAFNVVMLDLPMHDLFKSGREYISSFLPIVRPFLESYVLKQNIFTGAPITGKGVPLSVATAGKGGPKWTPLNLFMAPLAPLFRAVGIAHAGANGGTYITDQTQNILAGIPILSRFSNWVYEDPNRVQLRANNLASAIFGLGLRPVDQSAMSSAELDFYYGSVLPQIEYLKSIGYPVPTTSDLQHAIGTTDTVLAGLGIQPGGAVAGPGTQPATAPSLY